jgi:MvaI/BcnI restriction endonuclease family
VLLLGVCDDGRVVGAAGSAGSVLAQEALALQGEEQVGVLRRVPMPSQPRGMDSRHQLLDALCRVSRKGWIDSRRLTSKGDLIECASRNCGGYTLEAELGIRPNGIAEPDFHGWEVKQIGVGNLERPRAAVVTLMTPEPTGGVYARDGIVEFVERYGYPDVSGKVDRRNFGGVFQYGRKAERSGLTLWLDGFDERTGRLTDPAGRLFLVDGRDREAAAWKFSDLLDHWRKKHALAAYVPSERRDEPRRQYRYDRKVRLGEETSFDRFLVAVRSGQVYLDPGIKIEDVSGKRTVKKRNQFRVKTAHLSALYARFLEVDVCG